MTFNYDIATPTDRVLDEVSAERLRQDEKWGEQNHPFRYPDEYRAWEDIVSADQAKHDVYTFASEGTLDYAGIITEEYHEALETETAEEARAELIQLAACCVAAVESIDRNGQ